ncbi:MAG TPA: 4-hydroxy-tetrahydrodipicolinate reductase [Parachlamydiaceae bacterium]|nr:4-hydroxy-tetrahydrodipicolinate reductase [Parachlamydiaceae bacterium]
MKIALIGYGKMGKLIEKAALQEKHEIVARIDSKNKISEKSLNKADVCIDFSAPSHFIENMKELAALNQTVVAGTTGWYSQIDVIKDLVECSKIGFFYAPNFSIGVNIFYEIVKQAASLIHSFDNYDASGFEIHHHKKKDSPSGTAIELSRLLMNELKRKKEVVYTQIDEEIKPHELHFASVRGGQNPGQHTILFDSSEDTITLTHQARNREGFAKGALTAACWLQGKKGFYTMQDMIEEKFHA